MAHTDAHYGRLDFQAAFQGTPFASNGVAGVPVPRHLLTGFSSEPLLVQQANKAFDQSIGLYFTPAKLLGKVLAAQ